MSKQTLGGNRLGSGAGTQIETRGFQRSSHDMGYIWKSSAAAGTLIPFMVEPILPGSSMDIDLETIVMTQPTVGPLFGSYKIQLDVFLCPIRLYNSFLHMNALNIGLEMNQIKLPQMELTASGKITDEEGYVKDNAQINPSCLLSYLNIRGLGRGNGIDEVKRDFNALSYLMYWDIYKNYYANKQEGIGVYINSLKTEETKEKTSAEFYQVETSTYTNILNNEVTLLVKKEDELEITFDTNEQIETSNILVKINGIEHRITTVFEDVTISLMNPTRIGCKNVVLPYRGTKTWSMKIIDETIPNDSKPRLDTFPLENIDEMRLKILTHQVKGVPFYINKDFGEKPYSDINKSIELEERKTWGKEGVQDHLAIKTYQSDLFNNWISTEWIDGTSGVNALTAIDTSTGEFTIDALNMAKKVYDMLNGIAGSGGTYNNWVEVTFDHEGFKSYETPIYLGGLIRELSFDEVVSNAATAEQPLATLAGRGAMTQKKKGGKINVRVDEPSYIMGIFSITPRVDYSQGTKWDNNLKSMDDFHKPYLDEIGFQDLITDQMHWADTKIITDEPVYSSAGKVPAWINYMTNVNQVRGNFADEMQQMFMTLNRRYDATNNGIEDLTTYIDPSKFNHIFADTRLDAQNFWVQIKIDNIARRKMSAKVMPNL